ncbi:S1 family peptidase [Streptomyces sp. NPDC057654]|uniref:S1 family peptidase n=1 Tax=Streptomyces sp. NPDC057654 TaxID=3346196 RepID=UPI00368EE461
MAFSGPRHGTARRARRAGVLASASAALLAGVVSTAPSASAISQGTDAPAGAAPWMATLAFPHDTPLTERGYCGGTLIAPDRVLTAGHCVMGKSPADFDVYLGADQLSKPHGEAHHARGWFRHPGWQKITTDDGTFAAHDMAVVVLDQPVKDVRPAQIASADEVAAKVAGGGAGTLYGHGATEHTDPKKGGLTDRLKQGTMKLLPPKECAEDIPKNSVDKTDFCTTGVPADGGAKAPSVCPGDSGGPLTVSTPNGRKVAGVLSAQSGDGCDGSVHQGQFMNPAPWRQQALRPNPELAPTGTLRVHGTPAEGKRLDATIDALAPNSADVHYSWYEEKTDDGFKYNVPIDGATSSSLTVSRDLAGKHLLCIATLKSPAGEVRLQQSVNPAAS